MSQQGHRGKEERTTFLINRGNNVILHLIIQIVNRYVSYNQIGLSSSKKKYQKEAPVEKGVLLKKSVTKSLLSRSLSSYNIAIVL